MNTETQADAFSGPGPFEAYLQHLEQGVFRIQHCAGCGLHVFYPRLTCPHCGSISLSWVVPSGRGTVYAVSVVNRRAEKGGPYNVVLVDLEEGPRMMSRVDGVDAQAVKIGMRVQATIDAQGAEPCVVFVPVDG
ncbi:DNA-binding protein [Allopusillimonas soli]|uniref:OB-fold domain-containing protein n=1 Tax=Allopusillimonas soli TaxID=659016 RepID=A0A853FEM4_9BURK|nr:OB-fold domain-containing protein [Allopusillimonas soli]NYT37270.1 OB-fold domain-containing protein [Allopusillimonas soli]TEA74735.1 DNA-binding protein [Allopusillimonas soli]